MLVVYAIVSDSVVVILRLIARGIAVGVAAVYHEDRKGNPPPKEKGKCPGTEGEEGDEES